MHPEQRYISRFKMPIGPALPPHLAHLAGRADNSDEDLAGPSLPRSTTPPAAPAADQGGDDESEDDSFGPALPPHLLAARKAAIGPSRPPAGAEVPAPAVAGPSRPYSSPSPPRINSRQAGPSVGPARPPAAYDDNDDDSDDEIGPRPDAAVLSGGSGRAEKSAVQEFLEREERWARERDEQNKPKVLQREEWMLVPPSGGILASGKSPTSHTAPVLTTV